MTILVKTGVCEDVCDKTCIVSTFEVDCGGNLTHVYTNHTGEWALVSIFISSSLLHKQVSPAYPNQLIIK